MLLQSTTEKVADPGSVLGKNASRVDAIVSPWARHKIHKMTQRAQLAMIRVRPHARKIPLQHPAPALAGLCWG